jgi:hypothetical protein
MATAIDIGEQSVSTHSKEFIFFQRKKFAKASQAIYTIQKRKMDCEFCKVQ